MGEDEQEAGAPWPVPGATTTSTEGEKLILVWHERWGWQSQDDIIADQRAEIEALKAELEALKQQQADGPAKCTVCAKKLVGMWRTSGQGLCQSSSVLSVPKTRAGQERMCVILLAISPLPII